MKCRLLAKRACVIMYIGLMYISPSFADTPTEELIRKIKQANNVSVVTYEYKTYLKNAISGVIEDSIVGRLYKDPIAFLDSNKFGLTIVNNTHYCKIDFGSTMTTVYVISQLEKQLGVSASKMKPALIDLSDTVVAKYGKLKVTTLSSGNYRLDIEFTTHNFPPFSIELDGNKLAIRKITFEVQERDKFGESTGYSRIYHMNDFKYDFDSKILTTGRFFKQDGDKIILTGKYAKYHLNTLTKP